MSEGWQGRTGRENDDVQPGDRVETNDRRTGRVQALIGWQKLPVLMDDTGQVEEFLDSDIRKL